MDYPCGKFNDRYFHFSAVLFFIVQTNRQTDRRKDRIRHTYSHTDADDRYTYATPVGVSNRAWVAGVVLVTRQTIALVVQRTTIVRMLTFDIGSTEQREIAIYL